MRLLEERIQTDGIVREGNVLKVDSFLNHQMDIKLFREIGKEFKRLFANEEITKILTIEASGIGIACIVAEFFDVPVVFAKKSKSKNIAGAVYTSKVESFTHNKVYDVIVSKKFLTKEDKVLLNKIKHLIDHGNNMNPSSTFSKIKGVYFNPKWCHTADDKKSYWELELADLCAFPIHKYLAYGTADPAFDILKRKICGFPNYYGKGLKSFPL